MTCLVAGRKHCCNWHEVFYRQKISSTAKLFRPHMIHMIYRRVSDCCELPQAKLQFQMLDGALSSLSDEVQ